MHRQENDLYEFLLPESVKHRVPSGERTVKGTFDRTRAIRDTAIPLLAFGHPIIEMIARQATSTDAAGFLAAADPPEENSGFDVMVVALLQTEAHDGASAHQLLYVTRNHSGTWSVADRKSLGKLRESAPKTPPILHAELRSSSEEFIQNQFPDIDFAADHLHYIAIIAQ